MSENNLQPTLMSGTKPDERKSVICPWCGKEMRLWEDGNMAWFECMDCGAQTPTAYSETEDESADVMQELAYTAATRTIPILPLSKKQIDAMGGISAVWYVSNASGAIDVVTALDVRNNWDLFYDVLLFAAPPTFDDISEARRKPKEEAK